MNSKLLIVILMNLSFISVFKANLVDKTHNFPNGYAWGCLNISKSLPFCNSSLPLNTRINDLISRLSLDEK